MDNTTGLAATPRRSQEYYEEVKAHAEILCVPWKEGMDPEVQLLNALSYCMTSAYDSGRFTRSQLALVAKWLSDMYPTIRE